MWAWCQWLVCATLGAVSECVCVCVCVCVKLYYCTLLMLFKVTKMHQSSNATACHTSCVVIMHTALRH